MGLFVCGAPTVRGGYVSQNPYYMITMIDYGRDRISVVAVSNIRFLARIGNRSRTESTKAKDARRRNRLLDREDDGPQQMFAGEEHKRLEEGAEVL